MSDIVKKLVSDKRFKEMVKSFAPDVSSNNDLGKRELLSKIEADMVSKSESIRRDFRNAFDELERKFQNVRAIQTIIKLNYS